LQQIHSIINFILSKLVPVDPLQHFSDVPSSLSRTGWSCDRYRQFFFCVLYHLQDLCFFFMKII